MSEYCYQKKWRGTFNTSPFFSEFILWRCPRRYIAKRLVEIGYQVFHIFVQNKNQEHIIGDKEVEEKMIVIIFCDKKAISF